MKGSWRQSKDRGSENREQPGVFGPLGVLALLFVILLVFASSVINTRIIERDADFLAAVLPGVLETLANNDRGNYGMPALVHSPTLALVAQMKANDMAEKGYFAHTSPEGLTPWVWFERAGYKYQHAGENLAVNFSESANVARAWMDSPSHRENILSAKYTEIGIATAVGMYKGKETVFVVQMFGRPRAVAVTQASSTPQVEEQALALNSLPVAEANALVAGAESEKPSETRRTTQGTLVAQVNKPKAGTTPEVPEEIPEPRSEMPEKAPETAPKSTTESVLSEDNSRANDVGAEAVPSVEGSESIEVEPEAGLEADISTVPTTPSEVVDRGSFRYWFYENPTFILRTVYLAIVGLILASLGVSVYRGVNDRLPRQIMVGTGLIVLMLALMLIAHFTTIPMLTLW